MEIYFDETRQKTICYMTHLEYSRIAWTAAYERNFKRSVITSVLEHLNKLNKEDGKPEIDVIAIDFREEK